MKKAFEISKDSYEREYACYGLRRQEMPFEEIGDTMTHCSSIWDDGEETDEELDGVCALWLERFDSLEDALEASKGYDGEYVATIASDDYEYGQDENEVILRDPVVIAKE